MLALYVDIICLEIHVCIIIHLCIYVYTVYYLYTVYWILYWELLLYRTSPIQPESLCFVNRLILEEVFEQVEHEYFLTSEWVWRCARKLDLSANALPQCTQLNGFSPVWVLMWPCRSQGREKAFPHNLHLQGSVCVLICIFKAPSEVYVLLQYLQDNSFFPCSAEQWNCLCFDKPLKVA